MSTNKERVKWACIAVAIEILVMTIVLSTMDEQPHEGTGPLASSPYIDQQFSKFCAQNGKSYVEQGEYEMRKGIFANNLKKIDDYNNNDNDQNGDGKPDI